MQQKTWQVVRINIIFLCFSFLNYSRSAPVRIGGSAAQARRAFPSIHDRLKEKSRIRRDRAPQFALRRRALRGRRRCYASVFSMPIYLIITFIQSAFRTTEQNPSLPRPGKFQTMSIPTLVSSGNFESPDFSPTGKKNFSRGEQRVLVFATHKRPRGDSFCQDGSSDTPYIAWLDRRRDSCEKMDRECWDTYTIYGGQEDDEVLAVASHREKLDAAYLARAGRKSRMCPGIADSSTESST